MAKQATGVSVDTGKHFWKGSQGMWAGQRLASAALNGGMTPAVLRTNDVLNNREWIAVDNSLIQEAPIRLVGVSDLINAGLTFPITNAMGKTVYEYEQLGDMDPATISMDGMTRSEDDAQENTFAQAPIPITHKDFFINLRKLSASRNSGEPLDVTQSRTAGRLVAEELERMLFQGGPTFGALPLYGYTTHPNRNTVSFGTNGNWVQAAKTGENMLADVLAMIALAEGDRMSGPYMLYISRNASTKLEGDFKANGDTSVRERLMRVDGLLGIRVADQLAANNVVLVQMTSDVVQWGMGENIQTIQWDINGGFGVNFKAFAIQLPIIRVDKQNRSGIVHMS
jgi:uncharacterized linocin/CFP29 family protein